MCSCKGKMVGQYMEQKGGSWGVPEVVAPLKGGIRAGKHLVMSALHYYTALNSRMIPRGRNECRTERLRTMLSQK